MDLEDLKAMVFKGLPGWQITSDQISRHLVLSHPGCPEKRSYSYEDLLIASPEQILANMHAFCVETIAEAKKTHIGHSPNCLHSETKVWADIVDGHTIHLILCEKCGSVIFPKYIPGKMVPKAMAGSKPISIGSLSIPTDIAAGIFYSPEKEGKIKLKKSVPSNQPLTVKYKIEGGEMLVQDGDNWATAEKIKEESKKKAKKIDAKPGQRKVKFKPS